MKQYNSIYIQYPHKNDFIRELRKIKPDVKYKTLLNRWYDCRQYYGQSQSINKEDNKYNSDDKEELDNFRKLLFEDIKKYKKPRTREYLMKYGFTTRQINKLEDEGLLEDGMATDALTEEDSRDL
jgi:hypothetical protein